MCAMYYIITSTAYFNFLLSMDIGGHGFWDKGGVFTGVCLKKKFAAAFGGQNFFPPGCENFFSAGGFVSRQGCDFAKK